MVDSQRLPATVACDPKPPKVHPRSPSPQRYSPCVPLVNSTWPQAPTRTAIVHPRPHSYSPGTQAAIGTTPVPSSPHWYTTHAFKPPRVRPCTRASTGTQPLHTDHASTATSTMFLGVHVGTNWGHGGWLAFFVLRHPVLKSHHVFPVCPENLNVCWAVVKTGGMHLWPYRPSFNSFLVCKPSSSVACQDKQRILDREMIIFRLEPQALRLPLLEAEVMAREEELQRQRQQVVYVDCCA